MTGGHPLTIIAIGMTAVMFLLFLTTITGTTSTISTPGIIHMHGITSTALIITARCFRSDIAPLAAIILFLGIATLATVAMAILRIPMFTFPSTQPGCYKMA